ncbi:MAG: uroporphyrinogen decarboxylase family protein [Clostridia bacterium]|jgi:uroporphyrinogen decarboxylase|nr:uroporphyrinogen decarboxylase family protein [Clostridia bacterium]
MKKWIEFQLNNKQLSMPILSFPSIQIMNISVLDLVCNSDYQANGMKIISDKCPISASLSYMDLSVEAEAFNATIRYSDIDVPTVIGKVLDDIKNISSLKIPKIGEGRTGTYIEAIRKAKKLITDKPIFAGIIGPFSLAGRLMDITEIMVNCYDQPELVHQTLSKCSEFITNYLLAFKKAGADGVIMAEPVAGLLSPSICEEFSSRYIKDIINKVQDDSFIFIYHNCGNVVPLYESLIELNADAYHFGNAIDIEDMLKIMPKDKIIFGNINPILLRNGTIESVKAETLALLTKCSKYENFVISTGCDVPPLSNWDNIKSYFDTIKEFYNN